MRNKRILLLALLLATALLVVACTPAKPPAPTAAPATEAPATEAPAEEKPAEEKPAEEKPAEEKPAEEKPASLELTLEELAKFNGKDGQPAYVAVDGVIYDVTNAAPWKDGTHNGFEAGKDLTTEIKEKSPHGISKLKEVVEVGKLVP